MVQPVTDREKDLIRMIHRSEAFADFETGQVFTSENEFTGESSYLGMLRKKLIPGRKNWLREQRENQSTEKPKSELEKALEKGLVITLSDSNRVPEIEQRYNIHIGKPYRVMICGMNPAEHLTFDGRLDSVRIYADTQGFTLQEVELANGLVSDSFSKRRPFERQVINTNGERIVGFGSIIDEEGFENSRDAVTRGAIHYH